MRRIVGFLVMSGLLSPLLGVVSAQAKEVPMARDPEALKKAAYMVDKHVADFYRRKKLTVPSVVDDATFMRRSFLVSAGRIPTLDEARMFLEIDDADKREMLSAYLLKSDGYRSHMTNWMLDMFRVKDRFEGGGSKSTAPYMEFVRQAVANDMPWDELATRLLASKGAMWGDGNGAVGYYIRDKGMPLDNLANTMRIFAGTRMECAQCHDDPYGEFERMDFYHLAAFTNGQGEMNRGPWNTVWREVRDAKKEREEFGQLIRWLGDSVHYSTLGHGGKGRIKLPYDYQYSDGDPGETVGGRTPYGKRVRTTDRKDGDDGRERFAAWLTSRENPRFNATIVNRMWKRVMGTAIFEPVDEYVAPEKTVSPELMKDLVKLLQELDYDLKAFQHVLLLTKTFQFSANSEAFEAGMPQAFNGRQVVRMQAEQVWDSLVTLVKGDPDKLPKRRYSDTIYYRNKPVLVGVKSMSQLNREILAIKSPKEYRTYVENLLKEMKTGGKKASMSMTGAVRPGPASGLARASELASPAPVGHFLREFGQSDRDLIDSASNEANMAQVLSMMNGYVESMVVSNENAALYKALEQGTTDRDKVRYIFYSVLSRPPAEDEMEMLMRDVIDGSKASYKNLASALLASHEFIFIY